MLIDVPIYVGHDAARNNQGRVLLQSLRAYLNELGKFEPQNTTEIQAVADVALTLFDSVLTSTEQLAADGKGNFWAVHSPVSAIKQPNETSTAGEGGAV